MNFLPQWLVRLVASLAAALLLVLVLNQLVVFKNTSSNVDPKRVITISAQGKVTVKPDLLEITASVLTTASTAVDAQTQNTTKMNKVIAFVKSKGVVDADIQTSNYNIYPTYDYTKGNQTITGYSANQTITIKVHDFSLSSSLLDGLVSNGVNQIQNVNYTFSDPNALQEQAREQALSSAHDKAQKLAQAAGAQLGGLVTFTEDQNNFPIPYPLNFAAPQSAGIGGGPVALPPVQTEPGTQDITAQVTVTYSLK